MSYELSVLSSRPAALWNVATFTDLTGNGFLATPTGSPASYNSLVAGGGNARVITDATSVAFEAPVFRLKPFTLEVWFKPQDLDPTVETAILGQENFGIFATSLQIIGRIELETSEIYEVSYNLPPWKTAVHVALVFDNRSLALFVDGEMISVDIAEEDYFVALKQQTVINTLYSGVSSSAAEIVIDSPAIYGSNLPGESIQTHFSWGRRVMSATQIVAQSGGNMIRLSDQNSNIYREEVFETDEAWMSGTYDTPNIGDDIIIADLDDIDETVAGEWNVVVPLSSESGETVDEIKLGWIGEGIAVEVSLDGTIWTTLDEDEPLVPISLATPVDDLDVEIKVSFMAGLPQAYIRRLKLVAYRTLGLPGERGVGAEFLPSVLAENDYEPIQDYDDRGLQFGQIIIEEDPDWTEENLVLNGDASDGNTNFTDATYNADASPGSSGSFLVAQEDFEADAYIGVSDAENIQGEMYLKQSAGSANVSAGVAVYDADLNRILPENFMYYSDTTTFLTESLDEGDTIVYLNDVTNYPDASPRSDEGRGFIFWNHPDFSNYSRSAFTGLWSSGAIDSLENTIELDAPWAGETIDAGTVVNSYRSSGDTIVKFIADSEATTSSWVLHSGDLLETEFTGDIVHNAIWPGTAFVRPAVHIPGGTATLIGGVVLRVVQDDPHTISGLELWVRFEDTPVGTIVDNGEQLTISLGTFAITAGTLIVNGDSTWTDSVVPLRWYHLVWQFSPINDETVIGSNAALTDDAPIQIGQLATYEEAPLDNYYLYQGVSSLVIDDDSGITIGTPDPEIKVYDPDWAIVASG